VLLSSTVSVTLDRVAAEDSASSAAIAEGRLRAEVRDILEWVSMVAGGEQAARCKDQASKQELGVPALVAFRKADAGGSQCKYNRASCRCSPGTHTQKGGTWADGRNFLEADHGHGDAFEEGGAFLVARSGKAEPSPCRRTRCRRN
jgi:hypothetical protein